MTQDPPTQELNPRPRVLVISRYFAPCREVGGKRFTFLSRYLSKWCDDYHVLARLEHTQIVDETAFDSQVHRVRMYPAYPPIREHSRGLRRLLVRAWEEWLCMIDTGSGFVIPAALKGVHLCRKYKLSVVIVTVPDFSSMIAATMISKITGAKLIIDYRDPWTNHPREYPKPFGRAMSRFFERAGIRQASAVVLCSDIMRDNFISSFSDIVPGCIEVIYNGFDAYEQPFDDNLDTGLITMLYAGNFYGSRRLSMIAPVLAKMHQAREITAASFQWRIFSRLSREDYLTIEQLDLKDLISVHEPVEYKEIKKIMSASDILFLPSGDEVAYAVPFKFFDYLSASRPILAVAPKNSGVGQLMQKIDCGEHAKFGDEDDIRQALRALISKKRVYSFRGSEEYLWKNAASQYCRVIENAVGMPDTASLATQLD